MKLTELILIRHAETASNLEFRLCGWTDSSLTPRGLDQARLLGEHVVRIYPPDVLYSSPLERARLTATAIGRHLALPMRLLDGLKEIHFGDCEGLTDHEFRGRYPELAAIAQNGWDADFCWPGGESRDAFYQRSRATIEAILQEHAGQRIAVVSHGGTIASFLSWLIDGRPRNWRRYLGSNCAVTRIVYNGRGVELDPINDSSFLAALDDATADRA